MNGWQIVAIVWAVAFVLLGLGISAFLLGPDVFITFITGVGKLLSITAMFLVGYGLAHFS